MVVQFIVTTVFLIALSILLYEFIKYRKLKKLFQRDYLADLRRKSVRRYNLLIPRADSSKYKAVQMFIAKAGWNISVEGFFTYKLVLFLTGILLVISIQTTNQYMRLNQILNDVNYNKIIIDNYIAPTPEAVKLELNLYSLVDENVRKSKVLYNADYTKMNLEYIQNLLTDCGYEIRENIEVTSRRLLEKLRAIRAIKGDYTIYLWGILISIFLYIIPEIIGNLKIKLIEDRKDWEVLNCIYAFSIFGRLPPYSVKLVLENMSIVTESYKPLVNQLLEGIKKGYGEKVFDEVLERTDNDDMYELFETMKLACDTGILNAVDDIDEVAEQKLKWMEIQGIKRRNAKRLYAMTFVALMFLLAGIYFSYGLTILSNPAYLMPKV